MENALHEPLFVDPANPFYQCWLENCSRVDRHLNVIEGRSGPGNFSVRHVRPEDFQSPLFRQKFAALARQ